MPNEAASLPEHTSVDYIDDLELHACQMVAEGMDAVENGENDKGLDLFDQVLTMLFAEEELMHDSRFELLYNRIYSEIELEEEFMQAEDEANLVQTERSMIKDKIPNQTVSDEMVGEMKNVSDHFFFDAWEMENPQTAEFIHTFTNRNAKAIRSSMERGSKYIPMIRAILKEECMPEDLCYLPIIESGYKNHARSRAKAVGMWQFMSGTARMMGLKVNWWVDERCDPEAATRAAARYLKKLHEDYHDWYLTLAAYNAGPGRVNRAIEKGKTRNFWELVRKRLLPRESRNYIPSFMAAVTIARDPESFGFTNMEYQIPMESTKIEVDFCIDLKRLAREMGVTKDVLIDLNPALKRGVTPGGFPPYLINVPVQLRQKAKQALREIPENERVQWKRYRVRKGDTLGRIARKMGVAVKSLKTVNRIKNPRRLQIGQKLIIPYGPEKEVMAYAVSRISEPYIIRKGDTLSSIAVNYRTSVASILKYNPGIKPTRLRPGQKIYLTSGNRKRNVVHQRNFHIVKRGDTLYDIARKYGTSIQQICSMNGIRKTKTLRLGEKLRIPYPLEKGFKNYQVRKGDTLSKIAKKFQVRISDLVAWNSLSRKDILRIGQQLKIRR